MTESESKPSEILQARQRSVKILLGLDVHSESNETITQALAFATMFVGTELDIVWVPPLAPLPSGSVTGVPYPVDDPMRLLRERVEAYFADSDTEATRTAQTKIQLHIARGEPAQEISKIAFMRESQMIVVGAHDQRGAISEILLGSVAKRLVAEAPCPVLVVRPNLERAVPKVQDPLQDHQARRRLAKAHQYTGVTRNQKSGENLPLLFSMDG